MAVPDFAGNRHGLLEVVDCVLDLPHGGKDDTQICLSVGRAATVADLAGDREALLQDRRGVPPPLLSLVKRAEVQQGPPHAGVVDVLLAELQAFAKSGFGLGPCF